MSSNRELGKGIVMCTITAERCHLCADEAGNLPGMERCAELCRECAESCEDTVGALRNHSTDLCLSCADLCERCADECERHDNPAALKACEECRACAEQCRRAALATAAA